MGIKPALLILVRQNYVVYTFLKLAPGLKQGTFQLCRGVYTCTDLSGAEIMFGACSVLKQLIIVIPFICYMYGRSRAITGGRFVILLSLTLEEKVIDS